MIRLPLVYCCSISQGSLFYSYLIIKYKFRELNLIEVKEVIEVIASLEVNDVC